MMPKYIEQDDDGECNGRMSFHLAITIDFVGSGATFFATIYQLFAYNLC